MYDVVIIGAGSAGLAARRDVSAFTENYLVIDPGPTGTTCARVGCMPSKVLIEASHIFNQTKKMEAVGIRLNAVPTVDGKAVMKHVRKLRDHFVGHVLQGIEKWRATHLLVGLARFEDHETLVVGDRKIKAKKFIIATGSHPIVPWKNIEGCYTTDQIFEIPDLPKSLIVIGTGAIGLEIGHAFALLGVQVTAVGELKTFAGLTNPTVRDLAIETLRKDLSIQDAQVEGIEKSKNGLDVRTKDGKTLTSEMVLIAIGRKPNLVDLDLKKLGATLDQNGMPDFSLKTFRIRGTSAYIAGDVSKVRPILHEAVDQGRIAALNAVAPEDKEYRPRTRLSIIFTQPNIAAVGIPHAELIKNGIDFVEGSVSFVDQGRAVTKLENAGALHVYAAKKDGRLLGAEMIAPSGEHLAHLLAFAIEAERTVFCMLANPIYHPVIEEGLRTALKAAAAKTESGHQRLIEIRCDDAPAG